MVSLWKKCDFSRKEIDRAGSILREAPASVGLTTYINAYQIMDSWRASHAFPLNTIQMTLRRRAHEVDAKSEVVQRLKRAPSVISKLQRFNDMQLSRMQDLGGSRAILNSVDSAFAVRDNYRRSRDRHELSTEKDYISNPQDSGYRGLHLIYRYQSDRAKEYNGHRIEIQLRTRVQHAWATAVEIAGIYARSPLKSNVGPHDWLEYFKFVSSAFAIHEGAPPLHRSMSESEISAKVIEFEKKLEARKKLMNFSSAHQYIAQIRRKSDSHFILIMDLEKQRTRIEAFRSISSASARYAELEKAHINDSLIDVVLVAAENVESVTTAYPNYFADTSEFLRLLGRIVSRPKGV